VCGIVGKVTSGEPVSPALLASMCSVIAHRGPDSRGLYVDGAVALGIQRLAIIDVLGGDQPIFSEDRSVVVVLNGEIYNYRELRPLLEARGHRFATRSDTEVIVHLYEDQGDECVHHLRGMFAFALWDAKRGRLLVARDRVGKKPLFYAYAGGCFWFASEAKAILEDPVVRRDPDYAALDAFLQWGYVPHPQSAFAALRKLPPAHTLVLEEGRAPQLRRYWKLSYTDDLHVRGPDELSEAIRDHLVDATRIRLRSDVPLGAFLSGGVDSSAVVAAMAQTAGGTIRTFSIGFDSVAFDERTYARIIAERFATEHHEFLVRPDAVEILPELVWHYGEPFADQSAIPTFYLSQLTRQHVTVALNGDGGDESFAGYQRYWACALADRLDGLPTPLIHAIKPLLARAASTGNPSSTASRLLRLSEAIASPPSERYATWMSVFGADIRRDLYTREHGELVDLQAPLRTITDPYRNSDARTSVERLLDVDVASYLADQLLVKVDIASMAHSLEVRSPLLDHVFMEFAAGLPAEAKLAGRVSKRALKDALRAWIPSSVLDRPKHGFGVPLSEWFRTELRNLPREILLDPRALARGLFRRASVERLIADHLDGRADNSNRLWALIQLECWFQTFVDGGPRDGGVGIATGPTA
jgi:asparagine synthase (glutamine-hydrolysing)